jgi:FkbM family methyltransferase
MYSLLNTISFILRHPLNETRKIAALSRYIRWQVGSRILPGPVAVSFVDSTRLLLQPGMIGATGNVYCGLQEFEDMAFVLHVLRPGDLFADIGSNVGSYTVLAAGAAGANCVSFEPLPATFVHLLDNIRLNNLESKVTAKNIGLGASSGSLTFTSGLDAVNHVVAEREVVENSIEVPVSTLDAVLSGSTLTLMKIDVEGFETEVLNGASETMQGSSLLGAVIELNGSGLRYGYDEEKIHQRMLGWGFAPARYDPLHRTLTILHSRNTAMGNTLYVRNLESIRDRVLTAPPHTVLGASL